MNQTSFNIWTKRGMTILAVSLFLGSQFGFALETTTNITLDDDDDSPQVILVNENEEKLILQKLISGEGRILNNNGNICFVSSNNDTDNSICFDTTENQPAAIILSDGSTNKVSLKAPSGMNSDITLTLPDSDGSAGDILKTEGNGNLSWIDAVGGGGSLKYIDQTLEGNRTIHMENYTLTIDGTGANLTLPDESIGTTEIVQNAVTSNKLDNPDYYAPGVLSSFGYHTDDCDSTENFVHLATVNNMQYGLCAEKTRRPAPMDGVPWGVASDTCKMAGKRLADYVEWRKACDGKTGGSAGTTKQFSDTDDWWEWASSRPSAASHFQKDDLTSYWGAVAVTAGDGSCAAVNLQFVRTKSPVPGEGSEWLSYFRCFR